MVGMQEGPFAVGVGAHRELPFSVWLRGTEVEVKGYVEPADPGAGLMQKSLVIEELRPRTPDLRWRCPDIDELLDSGEYQGICDAFFDTWRAATDYEWTLHWWDSELGLEHFEARQEWRTYWLSGAGDQP